MKKIFYYGVMIACMYFMCDTLIKTGKEIGRSECKNSNKN